jgi:hypothetical protein
MKFIFNETGEIAEYEHTVVDGQSAVLVTRHKGTPEVKSRYYMPTVIEEGLATGWLDLIEDDDE